jgi:hypothetical protein
MFRPQKAQQMTTPVIIQTAQIVDNFGKRTKTYENLSYNSFCNWSSYGGSERDVNGVISFEETAVLTMFYDPNAKNDGRIINLLDNSTYEILSVENIEMRNQFMILRVRKIAGGA